MTPAINYDESKIQTCVNETNLRTERVFSLIRNQLNNDNVIINNFENHRYFKELMQQASWSLLEQYRLLLLKETYNYVDFNEDLHSEAVTPDERKEILNRLNLPKIDRGTLSLMSRFFKAKLEDLTKEIKFTTQDVPSKSPFRNSNFTMFSAGVAVGALMGVSLYARFSK